VVRSAVPVAVAACGEDVAGHLSCRLKLESMGRDLQRGFEEGSVCVCVCVCACACELCSYGVEL